MKLATDTERERWRDEMRRQAYTTRLDASKKLSAALWKMTDCLWEENSTPEQWQAAFVVAHDAWSEFSAAVAAVSVAGPREVAGSADRLRQALYELEVAAMGWHTAAWAAGHGRLDEHDERFKRAATAKREPDREFQAAARRTLGTDA